MDINILLQNRNISQYSLSKLSGVPYSTISDICLGKTDIKRCNVGTICNIAKALNTTVENLSNENKNEKNKFNEKNATQKEYYQYYLRNRKNAVLCSYCALDYLGINGNNKSSEIHVYCSMDLPAPYKVHKVKNFKKIEYDVIDGILVSSVSQGINDILKDEEIDSSTIQKYLKNYYKQNKSFEKLHIVSTNSKRFNKEKKKILK